MTRHALVTVAATLVLFAVSAAPALAAKTFPVDFRTLALGAGTTAGVSSTSGSLRLTSSDLALFPFTDLYRNANDDGVDGSGAYDSGTWTSPVQQPSFPFNELVASWNTKTPPGTWVQVEMQPRLDDGHWAKWYTLGQWSYADSDFHRTSVGGQGDADGFVSIDTFFAKDHAAVSYRLRVTLLARAGSGLTPTVSRLSAVASNLTNQKNSFPSGSSMGGTTKNLGVPKYSQEIHHGEYPQYDNGGEAWCSPTSTAMVVGYWAAKFPAAGYSPSTAETAWVDPAFADPWVDYTARYVYDYHYNGAGNWPFNAAYASERGLTADVTQLHDLREAEAFVKAGIPLVASIAFSSNKLTSADIKSTNGHLVVIAGFTGDGRVIANDPASPTNAGVEHIYDREQFERAWIPASGGIVYVIRPAGWPTPDLSANNQ